MAVSAALQRNLREAQRNRADVSRYKALILAPSNMAGGLALPASAEVFASINAATVANTAVVTVGSRTLSIPTGLPAGTRRSLGWFEKGKTLSKAGALASVLSLYVRDGAVLRKFAQA